MPTTTDALDDVRRRLQPGTRLYCVSHTFRPELVGKTRVVLSAIKGAPRRFVVEQDGEHSQMELPKTGVEWLDHDTFRYPLGGSLGRAHWVTLKILGGA